MDPRALWIPIMRGLPAGLETFVRVIPHSERIDEYQPSDLTASVNVHKDMWSRRLTRNIRLTSGISMCISVTDEDNRIFTLSDNPFMFTRRFVYGRAIAVVTDDPGTVAAMTTKFSEKWRGTRHKWDSRRLRHILMYSMYHVPKRVVPLFNKKLGEISGLHMVIYSSQKASVLSISLFGERYLIGFPSMSIRRVK